MKKLAYLLLLIGVSAMLYGNLPAQRISRGESQGATVGVCAMVEWDSEKLNFLPQYNPENHKIIAVLQQQDAGERATIKS
ncbi:hypothetical protein [Klebsiella aerogenes]|uniref:hypothetical protein n=1 Tax=Klebsiella aerogenes TaxID=548 RepID=UPI003D96CB57